VKNTQVDNTLQTVLADYGFNGSAVLKPFGSGLINHTWKLENHGQLFILQKINDQVFRDPVSIENNIKVISAYLKEHHPGYFFVAPVPSREGNEMIHVENQGYFRLFPFVPGSISHDVVETPDQAYEASRQFGLFTRLTSGLDVKKLRNTISSFHDISLRYDQFRLAVKEGNRKRITESADLIMAMDEHVEIVNEYQTILTNPEFKLRVTHHDTKISNVLFNKSGKGLCVIDLDTVMPGYFISDVGDMMRTYLSPVSEEEKDFSKIEVRDDFYKAIVDGYYSEMKEELTTTEKKYFFYAGAFMIYMQALRFLTDHLNNDRYYGAKYPGHNLVRAGNQSVLLQRLMEKRGMF
jgi:Ser/Thr protein kinase RdoA (MazF antagonist)